MNIKQIFQNFKNQWLGKRVDYDHVYNFQCVDLILQYLYQEFGLGRGVSGNAIDYWNKPSTPLLDKFHKIASAEANEGDIVVIKGTANNPYGHIGIATGNVTASAVEILEQNGVGTGSGTGGDAIRTRFINKTTIAGLLRANGADESASTPASPAPAAHVGQELHLPASVSSWRVYHVAGPWTLGHEIAKLNPAQYGGLTYDIVSNPAPNIYLINTQMFGQVAIYAGFDTPASFSDKPAPATTPPPAAVAPPPEPPKPANVVFTKFSKPLELFTKLQPTHVWDLSFTTDNKATSLETLDKNVSFTASGQAQRTDHDKPCYYMSEADFGDADTSGRPVRYAGINTVDLTPVQALAVTVSASSAAPPIADFRDSFKESKATYKAIKDIDVKDLYASAPDQKLGHDQLVHAAGEFVKDGTTYIRTEKSVSSGIWYGIPKEDLVAVANPDNYVGKLMDVTPPASKVFDDIDTIEQEIKSAPEYSQFRQTFDRRERTVAAIGHAEDKLSGFFGKLKIKKG